MSPSSDRVVHLTRRFAGSLRPGGAPHDDESWARAHLLPGEVELWDRLSGADRRHAAGVARDVERRLGGRATRPVIAAALLHDVGKLESGLGTFGRVLATLVVGVRGHARVATWANHKGLAGAGSDSLTMTWALEHHRPPEAWTIPRHLGEALKAADDA